MKFLTSIVLLSLAFFSLNSFSYNLEKYNEDIKSLSQEEKSLFLKSAGELKCPTCTTLGVLESDTPFSLSIREKVIGLVKEKKTEKEIRSFFVERYGSWLLRTPPKEGVHLLLWGVPAFFLLFFLCLVLLLVTRKKTSSEVLDDISLEKRFEEDLNHFRKEV